MMKFRENEEAVSPVIGVILMVAITVILAAVIAAFVFGMSGNVQSTKSVYATATHTVDAEGVPIVIVTFTGGPDVGLVTQLNVTVNDEDALAEDKAIVELKSTTGSSVTIYNYSTTAKKPIVKGKTNHVVVTATFSDGTSQVILDTII